MNPNVRLSEMLAVVGTIDPVVVVDTELFTDYIDMSKFHQCIGIMQLGNVNDKTFDFVAYGYSDEAAGDSTAIKSCTQLAAHATSNDGKQLVIGVTKEDLLAKCPAGVDLRYVRFGMVSEAAQDGPVGVLALAAMANYDWARDSDLASVAEIEEDLD